MISFELNGDSHIVMHGILLPTFLLNSDINGILKKYKIKVYLNDKQLHKEIVHKDNGWSYLEPMQLTKEDKLVYKWEL